MNIIEILHTPLINFDNIDLTLLAILIVAASALVSWFLGKMAVSFIRSKLARLWGFLGKSSYIIEIVLKLFILISGITIGFKIVGIKISPIYYFSKLLFHPFFKIGSSPISVISVLVLVFIVWSSIFLSGYIRKLLATDIYPKTELDVGIRNIIDTFVKYFVIAVGLIIGLQINGINLSVFATLGAGLMVGVGFGLQNIASNFISGIVILLERPIKPGDFIEIGDIGGTVESISARSTVLTTRNNINIIIPNSKFITENVVNWTHNDANVMVEIPIGISYDSDPIRAREVLLEIADNNPHIIKELKSEVRLVQYADSSINLKLEIWINEAISRVVIKSDIYFEIYKKFAQNNISIPFPQMDVHLKDEKKT